ncbi:MAG: twin-arginine translocase subunit TatC [Myxococcota bacterium]
MEDREQPLTAHLAELRRRVFRVLVALVLGSVLAWSWREEIFATLLAPAIDALSELGDGQSLQAIAPAEIFFTYLQCAVLAGFVLTLPIFFWQIWAFVAPGLYPQEKRVALPFVLVSTVLFLSGGMFGYFVVFPVVFVFFAGFSSDFVQAAWTMREVFAFTTRMLLALGIGFELPVLIFFLGVSGVIEPRRLLSYTKYFVLIAFLVGALLTPPDPLSQSLMAIPLVGLYLLGVGAAYLATARRREEPASDLPAVSDR